MRVGLILLPMWDTDTPPLGLNYIATVLREQDHKVFVYDYNLKLRTQFRNELKEGQEDLWDSAFCYDWEFEARYEKNIRPYVQSLLDECFENISKEIIEKEIEVLGLSVFSTGLTVTRQMTTRLRKRFPFLKIVYGGPTTNRRCFNQDLEQGLVDAVVIGEGETSIVDICEAWSKAKAPPLPPYSRSNLLIDGVKLFSKFKTQPDFLEKVPGIQYLKEKKVVETSKRGINSMDELPILSFDDFDRTKYGQSDKLPIMMSRGCVALCTFCDEPNFWDKFRWRSPEHIFKEMEHNHLKYGVKGFFVGDSLLNGHNKNLMRLCDLIIESGYDLYFGGNVRISKQLTEEAIIKLAKAGCHHLTFGMESGSQKILDLMKKGIKKEWSFENFKLCKKHGIEVHINLIVGFPGEEEEDFQMTLEHIKEVMPYLENINMGAGMCVGPGQDVYIHPHLYDIKLNDDGSVYYDQSGNWESRDGRNNIHTRMSRMNQLRELVTNSGLRYTPQNSPLTS